MPLPFITEPFPDELLSSWLRRIGQEYSISLEQLARHAGISETRPARIDHRLLPEDVARLAVLMRVDRAEIRGRLLCPLRPPARSLRSASAPIQICAACQARHRPEGAEAVVLRSWFEFWSIECQGCRRPMSSLGPPVLRRCNPAREHPNWFYGIFPAARRGAARLHAFARRPYNTTISPIAVLGLLSKPLGPGWCGDAGRWQATHRVADLFVPGLRELTRDVGVLVPHTWTAAKPVRLVTARTILFAALAAFLDDSAGSIRKIRTAIPLSPDSPLERWSKALPRHTQSLPIDDRHSISSSEIATHLELKTGVVRI